MRRNQPVRGLKMTGEKAKAVSVAVIKDNKLLLVERSRPPAQNMFAFPGGQVEAGEALEDAARRELREETWLTVQRAEAFEVYDLDAFSLTVFLGLGPSGNLQADDDAKSAAYFSIEEARALPMPASMTDCIEKLVARGLIEVNPAYKLRGLAQEYSVANMRREE
jgi:8-oxo-dGTP diphosphatase